MSKNSIPDGLPAAPEFEKVLLAAVLIDNAYWEQVFQLGFADWSLDSHRRIRNSMKRLKDKGCSISELTVIEELRMRRELEAVGGAGYIVDLVSGVPRRPAIEDYIATVKEKGRLRNLILLSNETVSRAQDQQASLDIISDLSGRLEKLTEGTVSSNSGPIVKFIAEAMNQDTVEYSQKTPRHIPSGIAWFDQKTGGGYRMGKITLVCAKPNVGKTPLAMQSVAYNCQRGRKAVVFSLEMEKEEVLRNLIPYVVDVPNIVVNQPEIRTPAQHGLIRSAYSQILEDWDLSIYDDDMDIDEICWLMDKEAGRENEEKEILYALDHFGLISGGDKNPVERETEHSGRLRSKIKKKRNAALLDLMQLRKARNREESNRPPTRDDVKGAGRIYEDAFACLILHREIDAETKRMSTDVLMDLCKLRTGGSIGSTKGKFDTKRLAFIAEPELIAADWYGG